jgi:hypothetical protein
MNDEYTENNKLLAVGGGCCLNYPEFVEKTGQGLAFSDGIPCSMRGWHRN